MDGKLFTSLLTSRLQNVLPHLIHPDQKGFTKGRSILEHVYAMESYIESAQSFNSPLIIAFLDQAKAYDRVEWLFLFSVVRHMGFGPRWLAILAALYSPCRARVLTNGFMSSIFSIRRGLRQGDPLSPFLYNIIFEVFLHRLRSRLPEVFIGCNGVKVSVPKASSYADDTAVMMNSPETFLLAMREYRLYSIASGAALNADKTEFLCLGGAKRPSAPGHMVDASSPVRYLGILFSPDGITSTAMESKLLTGIRLRLVEWTEKASCARGRALALNTFVLSKVWYAAQVLQFSQAFVKTVRGLCRDFLRRGPSGNVALSTMEMPCSLGGLGLIPLEDQLLAASAVYWRHLASASSAPWSTLTRVSINHHLHRPTLFHSFLPDVLAQHGRLSLIPAPWSQQIKAYRVLQPSPAFTPNLPVVLANLPTYRLFVNSKGAPIKPSGIWSRASTCMASSVIDIVNGHPKLKPSTYFHSRTDIVFISSLETWLHSGKLRLASVFPVLSPSPSSCAFFRPSSATLASTSIKKYRMGSGRRWLIKSKPAAPSKLLPNLSDAQLSSLWRRIWSDSAIPAKYQTLVWRLHHNSVLTGHILQHFVPGHNSSCPHCGSMCEDIDHRFWTCPAFAQPFWLSVWTLLGIPSPTHAQFWSATLPTRPNCTIDVFRLALFAGLWAIHRAFVALHFDNIQCNFHSLYQGWLGECQYNIIGRQKKATKMKTTDAFDQKWYVLTDKKRL